MEISKTPQFDALLDAVLAGLAPHERICPQRETVKYCQGTFQITTEDIEFLNMLRMVPPTLCPACRSLRRNAFVNTVHLYKRPNNAPGKSGNVISYVPPVSPLTVYDTESYRTIVEPFSYGIVYDENRPFIEQLYEQRLKIPQPAIVTDPSSINSDYTLNGRNLKNGYLVSGGWNSEDVWYSNSVFDCREIMDSYNIRKSEQCYESVRTASSYTSSYLNFSENCINSHLLYDCRSCQDCFGCVNLRNKRYCWFNEQLSKEEYEQRLAEAHFESRSSRNQLIEKFWAFVKTQPVRAPRIEHSSDVTGALITDSKNCHDALNCEKSEHVRHAKSIVGHRDSMDVFISGGSEKMYETAAVGSQCSNVKFSFGSKFITNSEFVINCRNCTDCFACIGLENKSYCIFNRQYEKEQYFAELDRIKTSLMLRGEYGEFLPYQFSTFAYNGSGAENAYPLSESETAKLGALWQPPVEIDAVGLSTIPVSDLPDTISEVDDSILEKAIICRKTGRPFRIVPTELAFYRKHSIPLPTVHPSERIRERFKRMGNHLINPAVCASCSKDIGSIYDSKDGWVLYCDECYQRDFV